MLKEEKNFLIYEPNILSRIDFIKELKHLHKDKKTILFKEKHTFIPKEIFNLPIKVESYNPDFEYKNSILIFFYAQHLSYFNENTIKLSNNENVLVTFSDKPFVLTEYLSLKNRIITENLPVCLFKENFYNKLYVNALFVRFKSTEKFAKEIWKDFLEKNEISSPTLLEYLDFLFENEVFEFLYFKIYIESTFKRRFEYSPELKITSNKVYKLINLLEETEISYCVVQNKTVASIIESIIKRKNIKTQVKLNEDLEEVKDSVIYFDFTIPTYQSNIYILISEDLKNYYLALAAKENLLYINCSEIKLLDYFVIEKLENHNTNLKNLFLKEENFLKFSSTRVNNSEYQTKKYFQRLESRTVYSEKRIKNCENKCEDSIEEEYKENEFLFKPFIYDNPVILELQGSFSEEIFVDLLKEIVKIKKYDQKTVLFVENVIDLPEILEKIYVLTKTPIYITNLEENQLKNKIYIHQLKFGTVPKYGYYVDFYFLQGSGTLKFTPNGIIIIYNAPSLQYKIEINNESMENYTFISNVNQRLTLTMLLKKIDKVFIRENTYFWKRVSIYEVPFLENRYDIQFNIHKNTLIQFLTCFYNHTLVFVPNSLLSAYEFTLTQNKSTTSFDKNLSVKCVKKILNCLSYEEFYYLECFLSQKGRILNYNLKESDLNKMKKSPNFIPMILQISSEINERFVNVQEIINKYHNLRLKHETNYNLIKVGYITPLRIIYEFPMWSDSNRILREFMLDKFIRFNFREEDCRNQVNKRSDYDTSLVFDHFRTFLLDGIFLGKKKFFFLAMSSSQLRQHSCLFMTPYFNTTLIGPDYIRNWMGDFSSVHNIGKCAARLGQVLSTTVPTLKVCDFLVEKDFIVNEYNFTDGIGMISFSFAKKLAYKLKLNFVPSAFQVRFAGFKGVLALKNINKEIILRESMKKFESNHRILEVISFAQRRPCFLNRQVVLILESLGIKKRDFMKFSDLTVKPTVLSPKPLNTFIRNLSENLTEQDEELDGGNFLLDLKDKCRIFINKGRILVGVIDEYDILEENEIFVMTKIAEEDVLDDSVEKVDNYLVLNSKAFIAKNPCLHPGDIRVVKGVNRKELYHYKEVVVFSKKGKRPIFNMCSGSDLDGDVFIVSWEECLIPNKTLLSDEYSNTMYLYRKIVSVSDIINFFVRYMQEDQIGLIANAHLAHSDKKENGVLSPESVRLAQLFNMGIDFPKTGYIASLPYDLFFNEVPDYLSQLNYRKYLSNKTIGVIFRRSSHLIMQKEIFCECKNCNFLVNKVEEILYHSCKFNTKEIKKEIKEEDSCDNFMVELFYLFNKENNLFNIEKYSNLLKKIPGTWEEKYISYKKISQLNHSFFDFLFFCNYIPKEEIFYQNKFESFIFHDRIFLTEKVEDLTKESEEYILICTDTTRNTNLKMLCPIDSVNLFNELFLLLLAGKFISLHEFSFIFSFFEFVIEMINNDFSRQALSEVIYSLSGMYFDKEEMFGLEEEFIDFLVYGNKINDSEQCVILSEEMREEETKDLPNQLEPSLKNKNERSQRRKSKDFNKMADLFLIEHRSNILFLISYLLCSEIPLKFKIKAMNHFSKKLLYNLEDKNIKMKEKISIRYFNEIVILGMFDCNDEVFLEERTKKYFLNLLNVGKSTLQVYKDNVRQFIVSHTLSTTDSVIVSIFPGYLYFYDLINYFKCNNFKLKKLRETISFDKKTDVNAKFINDSPLLYESQINSYLKRKGMIMDRQEESVKLQFNYKGNSYFLVLNSKFKTLKISLNKKLMGRLQIVNEGKDCNLEIYSEKVLFKNNQFTFNDHFFLKDKLSFLIDESLLKYEENNFKINSNFQNDEISELFFDVNTSVYFSNHRVIQELVLEKKYNFKCEEIESVSYVRSERVLSHGGCDYSTFEPYFGEIWDDLNLLFE